MKPKPSTITPPSAADIPRRSFLFRAMSFLVGGIAALVPVAAGAIFFVDPVTRKKRAIGATGDAVDAEGFIKVTTTDALAEDGAPRSFKVIADLQDFWNKFPDSEIGAVYLRRDEQGEVVCFNARCPHLGCTVNFSSSEQKFICPCHESSFQLDGTRSNEIPPRDLDPLDVEVRGGNEVWVKFQKFRAGCAERKPV
jgi:Rieske Fe-S protein